MHRDGLANRQRALPVVLGISALVLALAVLGVAFVGSRQLNQTRVTAVVSAPSDAAIASAYQERRSGVQVAGQGVVVSVLPDDSAGGRHQRFVLRLASGQTLLFAHNIDVAPRLASLRRGDAVAFSGVYEWNSQGGVVHWTHHDPSGQHQAGWLKHNGVISQ
jgi:hypothetical protein